VDKDVSEVLDAIAWAHKIVEVKDRNSSVARFVFKPLSLQDRNICNALHNITMEEGKAAGRKSRDELRKDAIKKGLWKISFDNDIKILREELRSRREEYQKLVEQSKSRRTPLPGVQSLSERIKYLETILYELETAHTQYIELPSVEYSAERARAHYAVSQCTLAFPAMTPRWPTHTSFLDETDTSLVHSLVNAYYRQDVETEAMIRKVARSSLWRIKWVGSKKNGGVQTLFGRDMYDLTLDQFRLVYWSQIYDSAFEAMEPPTQEIVDNDEEFDKWVEQQAEKRKQERANAAMHKKTKALPDGQEVGMMVNGFYSEDCNCGMKENKERRLGKHANSCPYGVYMYYGSEKKIKEVESIQSSNPDGIRRILAKEQRALSEHRDGIQEQDLRRDPATRAAFGMQTHLVGKDGKRK
jgi:hypothetical protein